MPIIFPKSLVAGDRLEFTSTDITRAPADYELSWALRGPSSLNVVALADGDEWKTIITSLESANLTAGAYQVWGSLTDEDGERFTIYQGALAVKDNPAEISDPYDSRTSNQKILDSIKTAIAGLVSGSPVQSYKIEGREASYYSLSELVALESRYQALVAQESSRLRHSRIRFR